MQQGNNNLLQQFMRFRNGFRGDARQQAQQLLNSGKVSQAQYDNAVRIAQRLQGMFSGMG
jgi:hypothetical protein